MFFFISKSFFTTRPAPITTGFGDPLLCDLPAFGDPAKPEVTTLTVAQKMHILTVGSIKQCCDLSVCPSVCPIYIIIKGVIVLLEHIVSEDEPATSQVTSPPP